MLPALLPPIVSGTLGAGLTAANAYGGYQLAGAVKDLGANAVRTAAMPIDMAGEAIAKRQIANNPLITRDVIEREFRESNNLLDNRTIGSLGRVSSSRDLFGKNDMPQSFVNKFAPKVPGSAAGSAHKADYNGIGR